jgi:serine/threonine protein kinase
MMEIKEGAVFDRFILISKKGSGSTAEVWEARDKEGSTKALKIFAPKSLLDDYSKRLIRDEFHNSSVINHPNLILPEEYLEFNGIPALVMTLCDSSLWQEYMKRMTLRNLNGNAAKGGCFSEIFLVKLLNDISSALWVLHKDFVHNDIKPANILVNNGGDDQLVEFYLSDFGITREMRDTILRYTSNYNSLTLAYAAPEKLRGESESSKSDVFSLGASLYEMIYGPNLEVPAGQILNNNGNLSYGQAGYSEGLMDLLKGMLSSNPELRSPVEYIKKQTSYYLKEGGWPLKQGPIPPLGPTPQPEPRFPLKFIAASALVLIFVFAGYLWLGSAFRFNYDQAIRVGQDLFLVEKKGKVGLVDSKGQVVKPLEYDTGKWEEDRVLLFKGENREEVLISY